MNAVESAKNILLHSGASWILWLLAALSAASLALVFERWLFLRARDTRLEATARALDAPLAANDWGAAIRILEAHPTTATAIAAAGLRLADRGAVAVDKAMRSAVALERRKLERGLAFLATVGNNAPFVG